MAKIYRLTDYAQTVANIKPFPSENWFHNLFVAIRKRQNEIVQKKIDYLYEKTYQFYLDLYLTNTKISKDVEIPEFLYRNGDVICHVAQANAERAMTEVIKNGRINKCYSAAIKYFKKQQSKLKRAL